MKGLTGVIIFVSGAVCGAVGSLFYLRGEFKKKVEEEVAARDMAIRELKRQRDEGQRELRETNRKTNEKISTELSKRLGYSSDNVSALVRNEPRTHSAASESKSEEREDEFSDSPKEGPADEPYDVSPDDFMLGHKEFDKTSLIFYRGDGVLCNEEGDTIEDINYILGENWERAVGKYEDSVAYIRNEKAGADYEVICEDRCYTDDYAV